MTLAINPVLRRRLLIVVGLVFALWASWKVSQEDAATETVAVRTAPALRHAVGKASAVAQAINLEWSSRADQGQPVPDLFGLPTPVPPPPGTLFGPPAQPALPLKYVGQLDGSDNNHVFLADAKDRVFSAKVGETVTDGWQLLTMDSKQLVFRHLATGHEQTILTGAIQ